MVTAQRRIQTKKVRIGWATAVASVRATDADGGIGSSGNGKNFLYLERRISDLGLHGLVGCRVLLLSFSVITKLLISSGQSRGIAYFLGNGRRNQSMSYQNKGLTYILKKGISCNKFSPRGVA